MTHSLVKIEAAILLLLSVYISFLEDKSLDD